MTVVLVSSGLSEEFQSIMRSRRRGGEEERDTRLLPCRKRTDKDLFWKALSLVTKAKEMS